MTRKFETKAEKKGGDVAEGKYGKDCVPSQQQGFSNARARSK